MLKRFQLVAAPIDICACGGQAASVRGFWGVSRSHHLCVLGRLLAQTPAIENGQVLIPRECHWRAEFLEELALFPNGAYDDQVDAFSQGLKWISENNHEPPMLTHYKMLLRKHQEAENTDDFADDDEDVDA